IGGKLSKKKKGYSVNDEKAKDKDKKAKGTGAEEEGTPKDNEIQAAKSDGAPASDSKPSSPEAAPSTKETPAATSTQFHAQANSVQTIGVKVTKTLEKKMQLIHDLSVSLSLSVSLLSYTNWFQIGSNDKYCLRKGMWSHRGREGVGRIQIVSLWGNI
uniref:Brain acid soluble protein 1 n=2 Tax=Sus scrofa TaxID=9823 RepID=A0A8D0KHA4_PIG